jgi:hypothetical protein
MDSESGRHAIRKDDENEESWPVEVQPGPLVPAEDQTHNKDAWGGFRDVE